eukprot:CAMPEP_0172538682 /NCGR_PEP_ID=MMETSP1067-20121228/10028_1 /TAXON_ID=265564 ORGANISM="Thalassiosira punctigera, Strain Tpunct2005C2" /NCGR_SAMPLE_ID=MMETSP1067 /ASSEMBLY_ACC=CAM_ASM_000444 /LENGTH=175 /DNA_ID=CAMNT_0013324229 /DNA_START=153 /DNA_END=680 /DNA_ORIENTATION=+
MSDFSSKHIEAPPARKHKAAPEHHEDNEDEWSKILSTAKMNEVTRVPMKVFEQRKRSVVRELDVREMREEDLESLRTTDPFLYYSIPGVRAASVALEDIDYSDLNMLSRRSTNQVSSSTQPQYSNDTKVVRRSCISFECDLSTMLDLDDIYDLSDHELNELSLFDDDELGVFRRR